MTKKSNGEKCLVCGKELKVVNQAHLNTHGMTLEEYKDSSDLVEVENESNIYVEPTADNITMEVKVEEDEVQDNEVVSSDYGRDQVSKKLDKEPKIKLFIPKKDSEKGDVFLPVRINDWSMEYKKGEWHEMPESVAKLVMDSLNMLPENSYFSLNNVRSKGGTNTDEALR